MLADKPQHCESTGGAEGALVEGSVPDLGPTSFGICSNSMDVVLGGLDAASDRRDSQSLLKVPSVCFVAL